MFSDGFQKTAKENKPDWDHRISRVTGGLLGAVTGHQAAKYLGASGNQLSHKAARFILAAAAADRMSRVALADKKKR